MPSKFYQQFYQATKNLIGKNSFTWATVAVSGGVDSITLLHSLVRFFKILTQKFML